MESPNRIRARAGLVVRAGVVGALLAACGGGGGGGDSKAGRTTSATEWAGAVCGQIGSWLKGVQSSATGLTSTVQNGAADLPAARAQLSNFFGDIVQRTNQMVREIQDAGVPDTDGGQQVADDLKAGLSEVKQIFLDGQARIQNLPTGDASAFQEQADQAFKGLTAAGDKIGQKFQSVAKKSNGAAMQQAFRKAPQCQNVGS